MHAPVKVYLKFDLLKSLNPITSLKLNILHTRSYEFVICNGSNSFGL